MYRPDQFLATREAPRPPTDRPKVSLTPQVYMTPGNPNLARTGTANSASFNRSETNLGGGDNPIIKDGFAKVKEEGAGFMKQFWNERFLILREKQLDFYKSNTTTKVSLTVYLRDIHNVTRSDNYPFSIELTKEGNKQWILKFETDNDVYGWMDNIYDRCPSMGGVSHPTGFSHRVHVGFDPVTGGFVGLPVEWERLLKGSALTKDDMAKNPQAVMEVLQFYSDKLAPRAQDPQNYPSLTPTPPVDSGREKQLGYAAGTSIAPPRQQAPGFQRQDSYGPARTGTPGSQYDNGYGPPKRADTAPQFNQDQQRAEQEQRRQQDDDRRRAESERRRADEDRERRARQEQEDREYNDSLPKTRVPLAQQEIGGGGYGSDSNSPSGRYNATRPAPPAPTKSAQSGASLPLRSLQAQRPAPSPPGQQKESPQKQPAANGSSPYGAKQASPANGQQAAPLARKPSGAGNHQKQPSTNQVKPLNVATKQPTGAPKDHHKQTEAALTKKEPAESKPKEARMSAMSDTQVMERLRSVVNLSNPLESYNKQKKIGQGASGSVYVARIRENAPSRTAQDIMRMNGPRAQVAIKQMDLRSQPRKELIVNEIIVMKESRHENIVNFLDAFLQEDTFELWVVMEFMEGGALTDVIDNNASITEDQIATICYEVCFTHPSSFKKLIDKYRRLARASCTCTHRTSSTVTSSQTTSCSLPAATSKSPISVSAPSLPSSAPSAPLWSAHPTGWPLKSLSKRSTAPRSTSGPSASWLLR